MLEKNRIEEIRKAAAIRRDGILEERKKAEEEREKRIRKTEDSLMVIGEAYQILAEGNEGGRQGHLPSFPPSLRIR